MTKDGKRHKSSLQCALERMDWRISHIVNRIEGKPLSTRLISRLQRARERLAQRIEKHEDKQHDATDI